MSNKEKDTSLEDDVLNDLLTINSNSSKENTNEEGPNKNSLLNEKKLKNKSIKDLRNLAKEAGITGYSKLKKNELITQLLSETLISSKDQNKLPDLNKNSVGNNFIEDNDFNSTGYSAEELLEENLDEPEADNWILSGPPTLNDPTAVRDPVDILTSYRDEKGKTIVSDKLLGSLKKRFNAISEIATLPNVEELTSLSGIGEQTAQKIWRVAQQYHHLNAKTAKTLMKQKTKNPKCSTGSQALDTLLGGGLEAKNLTEFFGEAGMGKTQICYTAAVHALVQKSEGGFQNFDPHSTDRPRVVWIDTEGTFKPDRITEIAKTRFPNKDPEYFLDNIVYFNIISTDMLITSINSIFQMPDNIVLIILDSLMAPFRFEYSHGVSELARRQQKITEVLGLFKRNMQIHNAAVLVTNQATTKMSMAGPISITTVEASGGFAVAHAVTHRIKLTKKSAGKNKGIVLRKAVVTDSPYLSAGEAEFVLAESGIADFEKGSIKIAKTSPKIDNDDLETEDDIEDDILA